MSSPRFNLARFQSVIALLLMIGLVIAVTVRDARAMAYLTGREDRNGEGEVHGAFLRA